MNKIEKINGYKLSKYDNVKEERGNIREKRNCKPDLKERLKGKEKWHNIDY